jgi:hypothetical protein
MNEIQFRLINEESDKDIMRTVLLSERNYYKYKQKLAKKLEKIQKEKYAVHGLQMILYI